MTSAQITSVIISAEKHVLKSNMHDGVLIYSDVGFIFVVVVERCEHVDGMKKPAFIPTKNIHPSTTKKGSKPEYVRPGRHVWSSTKGDRRPKIVVRLSKKGVPTKSVTVKKAYNVKKVKVIFRLTNGQKVTKVSV